MGIDESFELEKKTINQKDPVKRTGTIPIYI
jgi:hypothetical protein